jgi:hypothetical protein
MPDISQIVDVTISLETQGVTRQGFGVPLIVGNAGVLSTSTVAEYTSLSAMTNAGFTQTHAEYLMAQAMFTQEPRPEKVIVAPLTSNDYAISIQNAYNVSKDWYAVVIQSRAQADIQAAAQKVETLKRLFIASSSDAAVTAQSSSNVLHNLNASQYDRTVYLWSNHQASYPDAAWAGRMLPTEPGKATWKFKTLKGVNADTLTDTQSNYIRNTKKGNTYEEIGGVSMTREGTVVSGEFVDVIRDVDWLKARIQEDILEKLVNADKIPYTDAGIAIIENVLRSRLQDAVTSGVLSDFEVTVPKVASITNANKTARILPDVEFTGTLAGAIHKVIIKGRVSV